MVEYKVLPKNNEISANKIIINEISVNHPYCLIFTTNQCTSKTDAALYIEIQRMDNLLFEEGFNSCDFKTLERILASDLEFYHDNGGMQNKQEFIDATRKNICGSAYGKITRKAVANSVEIFPLYKNGELYGVLQNGIHEFYIQPQGKAVQKTGIAHFSCLWLLSNKKQ